MPERMSHSDYVSLQRRRVAAIAAQMLSGGVGMVEGARAVASLRQEVDVQHDDPDFTTLIAITSGDPPGTDERAYDAGEQACRNLILKFRSG